MLCGDHLCLNEPQHKDITTANERPVHPLAMDFGVLELGPSQFTDKFFMRDETGYTV